MACKGKLYIEFFLEFFLISVIMSKMCNRKRAILGKGVFHDIIVSKYKQSIWNGRDLKAGVVSY